MKVWLGFHGFLRWLTAITTPPVAQTTQQIASFIVTAWLCVAAKLGIPDLLKHGPLSAAEIANELGGMREEDIYRAMRMLVGCGFFQYLPARGSLPVRFRNNAASAILREDHPTSMRHLAILWHGELWDCYSSSAILHHLQTKEAVACPAFETIRGCTFWSHLGSSPTLQSGFNAAMENVDSIGLPPLLSDFMWASFRRVLDIGGANGSVMASVAALHPNLEIVIFDQPEVVTQTKKLWTSAIDLSAHLNRVEFLGGNFFDAESMPAGRDGDLYFLRNIIHDWSDEHSICILKSIRIAIGNSKAALALAENSLIPEFGNPHNLFTAVSVVSDMLMHSHLSGKERTLTEWKTLLGSSGFRFKCCHRTRGPISIIEAEPA